MGDGGDSVNVKGVQQANRRLLARGHVDIQQSFIRPWVLDAQEAHEAGGEEEEGDVGFNPAF